MQVIKKKRRFFLTILFLFLFLRNNTSLALEKDSFAFRERLIVLTLNELEMKEREKAIKDAFIEAIIKIEEEESDLGEIKKGELWKKIKENLRYSVSHSIVYNDNIYYFEEKESDIINHLKPTVELKLSDLRTYIESKFGLDTYFYSQHSQHSSQDINFDFKISKKTGKYPLSFYNSFVKTDVPPGVWGLRQRDLPSYWADNMGLEVARKLNRLNWLFRYEFNIYNYDTDSSNDYLAHFFYPEFSLRIAPKTFFLFGFKYGVTDFDENSDRNSETKGFNFGLNGRLSNKLSGNIRIGFEYSDYKNAPDFKSVTTDIGLNYSVSRYTWINFGFQRRTWESTYSFYRFYSISNIFNVSLNHRFAYNPNFWTGVSSSLEYQQFPYGGYETHDNIWSFRWNIGYKMRDWLEFIFAYSYITRNSELSYDYDSNAVIFTTTFYF